MSFIQEIYQLAKDKNQSLLVAKLALAKKTIGFHFSETIIPKRIG